MLRGLALWQTPFPEGLAGHDHASHDAGGRQQVRVGQTVADQFVGDVWIAGAGRHEPAGIAGEGDAAFGAPRPGVDSPGERIVSARDGLLHAEGGVVQRPVHCNTAGGERALAGQAHRLRVFRCWHGAVLPAQVPQQICCRNHTIIGEAGLRHVVVEVPVAEGLGHVPNRAGPGPMLAPQTGMPLSSSPVTAIAVSTKSFHVQSGSAG